MPSKAKGASVKRIWSTYPRDFDYVCQDCCALLGRVGVDGLVGDPIRKLVNFLASSFDRWTLLFNPPGFEHFAHLDVLKHFMVDESDLSCDFFGLEVGLCKKRVRVRFVLRIRIQRKDMKTENNGNSTIPKRFTALPNSFWCTFLWSTYEFPILFFRFFLFRLHDTWPLARLRRRQRNG